MNVELIEDVIIKHLGWPGRMIAGSKSSYRIKHPDSIVIFNANLALHPYGKVWYGDIDLTKDLWALQQIAKELDTKVFIFYEMDYRFDNEELELEQVKSRSETYYIINVDGSRSTINQ